jgi:hypothetical protein
MTKDRKTVSIDALLDYANGYLSADYPNCDAPEEIARRNGLIDMIEAALHAVAGSRTVPMLSLILTRPAGDMHECL